MHAERPSRPRPMRLSGLCLFVCLLAWSASASASAGDGVEPRVMPRDCPHCPELVRVPGGRFQMGSLDGEPGRPEGPPHEVRIARAFAMGRTEVTVAEFRSFVAATGYAVAPGCRVQGSRSADGSRVDWVNDAARTWRDPGFVGSLREDQPVVCVGRSDALAYVAWLAQSSGQPYRLPSESEWEYAARAGGAGDYPWGSDPGQGCGFANLYDRSSRRSFDFGWDFADCEDGFAELAPVGSLAPNAFGLHDMIGNVWEWTQDCYRLTYDAAPDDGSPVPGGADCERWAVRGGSWMTRPSRNRSAFRGRDPNDARYSYFGFRVARDLAGPAAADR